MIWVKQKDKHWSNIFPSPFPRLTSNSSACCWMVLTHSPVSLWVFAWPWNSLPLLLWPWCSQSCFLYFPPTPFLHAFSLKCPCLGRGLSCALQWVGWLWLHPAWRSASLSSQRPPPAPTANTWAPAPRTTLTQVCETRAASVFPSCGAITGTSGTFECS